MKPMGKTDLKLVQLGRGRSNSGYDDQGTSEHISPALVEPLKSLVGIGNLVPAGA